MRTTFPRWLRPLAATLLLLCLAVVAGYLANADPGEEPTPLVVAVVGTAFEAVPLCATVLVLARPRATHRGRVVTLAASLWLAGGVYAYGLGRDDGIPLAIILPSSLAVGVLLGAMACYLLAPTRGRDRGLLWSLAILAFASIAYTAALWDSWRLLLGVVAATPLTYLAWRSLGTWRFGRFLDRLPGHVLHDPGRGRGEPSGADLLRFALKPLAGAFAVATMADVVLPPMDPGRRQATLLLVSFAVLTLLSWYAFPAAWLRERAGLVHRAPSDRHTREAPLARGVPGWLSEHLVGGSVVALAFHAFSNGALVDPTGAVEGAATLAAILWYLVPAALVPTLLYVDRRLDADVARLLVAHPREAPAPAGDAAWHPVEDAAPDAPRASD